MAENHQCQDEHCNNSNNATNEVECSGINERIFTPPSTPGEIIALTDDEGKTYQLEYLGLVKFRAADYGIFFPVDFYEGESGEVIIMKLKACSDEGDTFVTLDDEREAAAVYKAFKVGAAGYYDFGD